MSTIHANSARDALARLENLILMANTSLPERAIRAQITSAVDLIVQTERMRDGVRRVTELVEVSHMEGETIALNTLFEYRFVSEKPDGGLNGVFEAAAVKPRFLRRLGYFGLDEAFLETLRPPRAQAA
jgi:pilus assembly protein CpaF